MNYYLKYLKYKQKYLDLKNLDLIGGLSLSNNNLEGGVPGIASDYEEHAHLLDDYGNEEIADYWRTNINSTTFSANTGIGGVHQPGYYLMFYDSNGDYYDTTNDENADPRNPKFFNNHIHLLESKFVNGRNAISFILKLKNNKIKINQQCFTDAEHLNEYCKIKGIVGYDKLRMMIFLLKDSSCIDYHLTNNQYDILLNITNPKLTYVINGVKRPILTRREITKCIETLETYAIICTAISKIDEINTGRTGGTILYEAMNPTQFNQYLVDTKNNGNLELFKIVQQDFLRKTEELILDSKKLIIKMGQVIFDLKSDFGVEFSPAFSDQLKLIQAYISLKESLEENALKIREVNEDNSHHLLIEDMGLDKNEMLTLNSQDEPYNFPRRYNWDTDEKNILSDMLSTQNEFTHWPKWYDWLVKRKDISKDNIEYRKRVEQRAIKLEEMERARQATSGGPMRIEAANPRFNPY
jgi:hypothetical protein